MQCYNTASMPSVYFFSYDTLLENGQPYPGAVDFIRFLVRNQLPFLILTDRSSLSCQRLAEKMYEVGFPLLSEEMIYTTLMASIDAISNNYPDRRKVWYIGTDAVKEVLEMGGFEIDSSHPQWVFICTDRNATYRQYGQVLRMILNGAVPVSVSDRLVDDTSKGYELGCGALVSMLENASRREALTAGWSSPVLIKKACRYFEIDPKDVIFISKNLDIEIASANEAHVNTVFVMGDSGTDLSASKVKPTYVIETMRGLFR